MILGFTVAAVIVAGAAALLAVVLGLVGRRPSDLSLAGPALVELLLVAQLVIALIAPAAGNPPSGSIVEFYAYLLSALVIPPAAIFWALTEKTRWSVVVVGIACFAVAVMFVRMQIIWTLQGA
ncbi:hypothetical protein [Amnibacterium kyonggiense]|uniref:Integral membrane protein n=1 Tax=Amnibacterium kyonggiense TaxID=595671 RepID=A0A4R7FGI1_9MICO|nr:hypothetical protein [Amnibacterium kyonggiense]TDS75727.1 hypothetical protein CLV52_2834 [Amnibacterium kyonggiense]